MKTRAPVEPQHFKNSSAVRMTGKLPFPQVIFAHRRIVAGLLCLYRKRIGTRG